MIVAIDIGGTAIKCGVFKHDKLEQTQEHPSLSALGSEALVQQVIAIIEQYQGIKGIAVATAGQVNVPKGEIAYAGKTIPGYTGYALRKKLESHFGVPVYIENDVNCAIYSEVEFGEIVDDDWYVGLTIGTGIGGAVIANKEIVSGSYYSIGEFGYLPIKNKPFETIASTSSLILQAQQIDTTIHDGVTLISKLDDPRVKAVFDAWVDNLVEGLKVITICFNPKKMIIGGGILNARETVYESIKQAFERIDFPPFIKTQLVPTTYYNDAGMVGAYALFRKYYHEDI